MTERSTSKAEIVGSRAWHSEKKKIESKIHREKVIASVMPINRDLDGLLAKGYWSNLKKVLQGKSD